MKHTRISLLAASLLLLHFAAATADVKASRPLPPLGSVKAWYSGRSTPIESRARKPSYFSS
jgi:hypothetical protein